MFKNKLLLFYLSLSLNVIAQSQIPTKCDLTIEHNAVTLVGNVLYLDLKLINRSDHAIDNIKFSVSYYNIYNEFIATKKYIWETGYLIETLKPHTWTKYYRPAYINSDETVKRYTLTIDRIHFTDGTICDDSYVSYKETQRLNETSLKKLWVAKTKMDSSKAVAKIINEKNNPTYIEPSNHELATGLKWWYGPDENPGYVGTAVYLKRLWNALQGNLDVGTYEEFKSHMTTPELRKKFYDAVTAENFDIGPWGAFEAHLSGQLIPAYVGTAKEFVDQKSTNWMVCKDGFPPSGIPYGCKSDTIRLIKHMLGLSSTNDGVYGNDFIQQLVNDGFITPDKGEQYKKDHSFRITKDLYNQISQRLMTHDKLIYNPSTIADIDSCQCGNKN